MQIVQQLTLGIDLDTGEDGIDKKIFQNLTVLKINKIMKQFIVKRKIIYSFSIDGYI